MNVLSDQLFNGTYGFLRMLESKIFTNGPTTLPKPVREALSVEVGDTVRYVISEKGVQLKKPNQYRKPQICLLGVISLELPQNDCIYVNIYGEM